MNNMVVFALAMPRTTAHNHSRYIMGGRKFISVGTSTPLKLSQFPVLDLNPLDPPLPKSPMILNDELHGRRAQ